MALNSLLDEYATVRNIKYLSKAADVILPQLRELGVADIEVEIESLQPDRSAIGRFFKGIDHKNVDKVMTISGVYQDLFIVIIVPMINNGWLLPIAIRAAFGGECDHKIVCKRGMLGRSWTCAPPNEKLTQRLESIAPKTRKNHQWLALVVKIESFYEIGPMDEDSVLIEICTGIKRGMFDVPKIDLKGFVTAMPEMADAVVQVSEKRD